MRANTWEKLDKQFASIEMIAGRQLMRAVDVPTPSEIDHAASSLKCTFTEDYIGFLTRFGGAMVGSLPVYGLRPVEVMGNRWSVLEVTRFFREQQWPGVSDWYIVSEDGFGNPIGIAPDGRVMISDHDVGQVSVVAQTFEEFLIQQCSKSET